MNFCNITIGGHIGKDAESASTANGIPVVRFSLAVKTGYGDNVTTTWYKVKYFSKAASNLAQWLKKGKPVIVNGEFSIVKSEYEGKNYETPMVIANQITFVGSEKQQEEPKQAQPVQDEIPF